KLASSLPAAEFMKPLRRIVLDLAHKTIKVSGLKDTAQQIDYIDKLDPSCRPDLSKKGTLRNIETIAESEFAPRLKRPLVKRGKSDPSDRNTIVPRDLRLNIQDNRDASTVKEFST